MEEPAIDSPCVRECRVARVLKHRQRAHPLALHHGLRFTGLGDERLDVAAEQGRR